MRPRRRPARASPRRARPDSRASSPRGRPDPRPARARTGPRRPARPRAGCGRATSSRRRGRRSRGTSVRSRRRTRASVVPRSPGVRPSSSTEREADDQLRQARTGGHRGEPVRTRPTTPEVSAEDRDFRQGLGRLAVSRVDLRGGVERGRAEDGPALPRQLATDEQEVFGPQPLAAELGEEGDRLAAPPEPGEPACPQADRVRVVGMALEPAAGDRRGLAPVAAVVGGATPLQRRAGEPLPSPEPARRRPRRPPRGRPKPFASWTAHSDAIPLERPAISGRGSPRAWPHRRIVGGVGRSGPEHRCATTGDDQYRKPLLLDRPGRRSRPDRIAEASRQVPHRTGGRNPKMNFLGLIASGSFRTGPTGAEKWCHGPHDVHEERIPTGALSIG